MMVLEIMTVLMMVLGKASTELGINTNGLVCCDCDNFYTYTLYVTNIKTLIKTSRQQCIELGQGHIWCWLKRGLHAFGL